MSEQTKTQAKATEAKATTESDLRSQAYNTATRNLREKYRDEFTQMVTEEAAKLGVTYTPRLTPEQRAQRKLEALYEEFPNLRPQAADDETDEAQSA